MRTAVRLARRTLPIAVGSAMLLTLNSSPASASSGWWTAQGGRAEGFYNSINGHVYANDLKKDGYSARTQVRTAAHGYVVTDVTDKFADGYGSWKTPTLYAGVRFKMRVCVVKGSAAPKYCGSWQTFER